MLNIKNFIWDFDGVILDSMPGRDKGFRDIFKAFPPNQIDRLITFHLENGGLSRFVKIRYFFEDIRQENISNEAIHEFAQRFSQIMRQELINPSLLIFDTIQFIKQNFQRYNFHIASGSEQTELRYLCEQLDLTSFFVSIHGSPTPKTTLVKYILEQNTYSKSHTVMIGDSINDADAARDNGISFWGYNNPGLRQISDKYIQTFSSQMG